MLVALDIVITPELKAEGIAREVINRIQMLRKAADLEPSDPVVVFYKLSAPENTKAEPISEIFSFFCKIYISLVITHHVIDYVDVLV